MNSPGRGPIITLMAYSQSVELNITKMSGPLNDDKVHVLDSQVFFCEVHTLSII